MERLFTTLFLFGWLLCVWAAWSAAVSDAFTAVQFALLTVPPSVALLSLVAFGKRMAE
jgi:hypothetical protein